MSIAEIRIRNMALERDLKRLLTEFQEETGTCVETVELRHSTGIFYVVPERRLAEDESVTEVRCKVVV